MCVRTIERANGCATHCVRVRVHVMPWLLYRASHLPVRRYTTTDTQSHSSQSSMAERARKRPRFVAAKPPARIGMPAPKAHDLIPVGGSPTPTPPPPEVARKLDKRCFIAGVDVETHDWEGYKGVKGGFGQYGFYSICRPNDLNARIVQIGWAVGAAPDALAVNEHIVQPSDFQISTKAAHYHGISHHWAMQNGRPLREVLEEFMNDMISEYDQGRRIVDGPLSVCMCRAIYPTPAWLSLCLSAHASLQYGRPAAFARPHHELPISCVGRLPRFHHPR